MLVDKSCDKSVKCSAETRSSAKHRTHKLNGAVNTAEMQEKNNTVQKQKNKAGQNCDYAETELQ
jgi:hypothetical protein